MTLMELLGGRHPACAPSRRRALLLRDRAAMRADLAARRAALVLVDERGTVVRVDGCLQDHGLSDTMAGEEVADALPAYLCLPAVSALDRAREAGVVVVERGLISHASNEGVDLFVCSHARGRTRSFYSLMLIPSQEVVHAGRRAAEVLLTEATAGAVERELDQMRRRSRSQQHELAALREEIATTRAALRERRERVRIATLRSRRQGELARARRELEDAILSGARVGAVRVDAHGRVQRFTHPVCSAIEMRGEDLGRHLNDVPHRLDIDLATLLQVALDGTAVCHAASTSIGQRFTLHLTPLPGGRGVMLLLVADDEASRSRAALLEDRMRLTALVGEGAVEWTWTEAGFGGNVALARLLGAERPVDQAAISVCLGDGFAQELWSALAGLDEGQCVDLGSTARFMATRVQGEVVGVCATTHPVDVRVVRRLQDLEERGVGAAVVDAEGTVLRLGATAAAMLDVEPSQGADLRAMPSALGGQLRTLVQRALREGGTVRSAVGSGGLAELHATALAQAQTQVLLALLPSTPRGDTPHVP